MTWDVIRSHYARRLAESGLTQKEVAIAGHLSGQNAVSKLLANDKSGPSVELFVNAVLGLGISLQTFFAGLEEQRTGSEGAADAPDRSIAERLQEIEATLATMSAAASMHGSAHEAKVSTVPAAGNVVHINLVDEQRLATVVHTVFDRLSAHLERLATGQVGPNRDTHAGGHSSASTARTSHR